MTLVDSFEDPEWSTRTREKDRRGSKSVPEIKLVTCTTRVPWVSDAAMAVGDLEVPKLLNSQRMPVRFTAAVKRSTTDPSHVGVAINGNAVLLQEEALMAKIRGSTVHAITFNDNGIQRLTSTNCDQRYSMKSTFESQ